MGYSVLYIAFGIVALWLLGEVLLQYKARLRWRLLAFAGFMGVVGGVALRDVVVIVLGALAFGAGQSFVTLSYKRGFSTGWALGGRPGSSRRRRGGAARPAEPVLEVTPVEAEEAGGYAGAGAREDADVLAAQGAFGDDADERSVFQPMPMHEDSGEYPLYDGRSSYTPDPYTSGGYEGYGAQGYESWNGEQQPAGAGYGGGYQGGYDQQQTGWGGGQGYGYDQGGYQEQQQPAAASYEGYTGYTDEYGGYDSYGVQATGTGDWTPQPHPQHTEPAYREQQPADPQGQPADPYGGYGYDPQQQPYIPHQQHQSPYEGQGEPRYAAEPAEYADPYDPYRY
ncbi:hypothetical protein [Actinacidiphila sp. ITFR-21]|uniref:hypothetical protein n=1 Tax=Actinacidiphila sp. ITFR-21 TaxID=3075199 RepID=UPI00288AD2D6|nr:hypothetical protein [Streptomyces sp. ITFR-21]WNI15138.1 hypothetical protein RLT57_06055 [Streptomyces sp. ITFR-21]